MKGISDVIAVLLMLIITIALAGLAYAYITGVFASRTAVVLSISGADCASNGGDITVYVRNDGTADSGPVSVTITGTNAGTCTNIPKITAGNETSTTCTRTGSATGYYKIRATTTGSTATGMVHCPS